MHIGLFTNAHSAHGGGGVLYLSGWAQALREFGPVDLHFRGPVSAGDLSEYCGLDLDGVSVGQAPEPGWLGIRQLRADRVYDLIVRQAVTIPRPAGRRAVLVTDFPLQRSLTWRERQYLKTYSIVVANSHFTSEWVTQRWGRSAIVIHPAVRQVETRPKKRWIVSVGRFTRGMRSKHQLDMIRSFRLMQDGGLRGWELHLCGGSDDPACVEEARSAATGLPVRFHVGVPRQQLDEILGHAGLFWHATGMSVSEQESPELMEHFGISTGEAMSAGCIPIVVGRGGLREVVGEDFLCWTWQSWGECIEKTRIVMESPELRSELAGRARRQAERFSFASFRGQAQNLVLGLMNGASH